MSDNLSTLDLGERGEGEGYDGWDWKRGDRRGVRGRRKKGGRGGCPGRRKKGEVWEFQEVEKREEKVVRKREMEARRRRGNERQERGGSMVEEERGED